jgi:glycosyltransferase involved in cell wall biosynthesis
MEEMEGDWGKLGWTELGEGSHRAMVELARRRPDITVIVKTKGQRRKKDDILLMLQLAADTLPANLKVIAGGDPFDLMTESRVVVGFNTTGLLEAIAAGKPVIVPWFGEAQEHSMRDHIIDLNEAVTYARSEENLIRLVSDFIDHPRDVPEELDESVSRVLKYWVGNHDSAAGARVHQAIKDAIAPKLARAS